MGKKKRRHHFVPQFYLRNFSPDRKTINAFRPKQWRTLRGVPIASQAFEWDLYGTQEIEDALARLEGKASTIIRHAIGAKKEPEIDFGSSSGLILFVLFLSCRTTARVNEIDKMTDYLVKLSLEGRPDLPTSLDEVSFHQENAAAFSLSIMSKLYPTAFDLELKILKNHTAIPFVTSDNPVVMYNQFLEPRKHIGSNVGIGVRGLQMFLPLSVDTALVYYDSGIYRVGGRSVYVEIENDRDVDQLNRLQAANCTDSIFFSPFTPLNYARGLADATRRWWDRDRSIFKEYPPHETCADGTTKSLLHWYTEDARIGLNCGFCKVKSSGHRKFDADHVVQIRNPELRDLQTEFSAAVDRGEYDAAGFFDFLRDRGLAM